MRKDVMLGIDAGGTHTDAVLVAIVEGKARIEGQAKVETRHDDLPLSVREVLKALKGSMGRDGAARIAAAGSVTRMRFCSSSFSTEAPVRSTPARTTPS